VQGFTFALVAERKTVGGGDFVGYDDDGIAFSMRRIPQKYEDAYMELVGNYTTV